MQDCRVATVAEVRDAYAWLRSEGPLFMGSVVREQERETCASKYGVDDQ
jgi:hypothetical protein